MSTLGRIVCLSIYLALTAFTGSLAQDKIKVQVKDLQFNPKDMQDRTEGKLRFVHALHLTSSDRRFGGFSGLRINEVGDKILAVTDRGNWFSARLNITGGTQPTIIDGLMAPVLDIDGQPLTNKGRDAEAIALMPDGKGIVLAFEQWHRIWQYPIVLSGSMRRVVRVFARPVQLGDQLDRQASNGGIEAMTTLLDGRLLLLSERLIGEAGDESRTGWLVMNSEAHRFTLTTPKGHSPTDAATLANGDVMLLLRRYHPLQGVSIKLAIIAKAELVAGGQARAKTIASFTPPRTIDNMEGLAVRRGQNGLDYIYIISDNNFSPLQRTILMMFEMDLKEVMAGTLPATK